MTDKKEEPGFFESMFAAGTRSVRGAVARRCARAWEHGYAAGQQRAYVPEARPSDGNPFVDGDGDPRMARDGLPVVEPPDPDK